MEKLEKLQELEEKQAIERWELLTEDAKQKQRDHALMILGGVHVADKIAISIDSQVMNALITFQQEGLYRNFGFDCFADFLDQSEYSPMKKSLFYKRRELYLSEGGKLFDLMNSVGISVQTRRLLSSGEYRDQITLDGDKLLIGDEEADISNARLVRNLIETYAADLKEATESKNKKIEQVEKLEAQLEKGKEEYEELRRALDSPSTPYDKAYVQLLLDLGNLAKLVKTADVDKSRAEADIRSIMGSVYRYKDTILPEFVITENPQSLDDSEMAKMVREAVTDDFGDEFEQ